MNKEQWFFIQGPPGFVPRNTTPAGALRARGFMVARSGGGGKYAASGGALPEAPEFALTMAASGVTLP
jgi:hypothetical protein